MGINEGDTYLLLKPANTWTRFHTKDDLIAALDRELSTIPGIAYDFTQPMAMRIGETVSGVKADLAIKVFGDDFRVLNSIGEQSCTHFQPSAEPRILRWKSRPASRSSR